MYVNFENISFQAGGQPFQAFFVAEVVFRPQGRFILCIGRCSLAGLPFQD